MELFGILFAFPATLFISVIYVMIALAVFGHFSLIKTVVTMASLCIVLTALAEVFLLSFWGAKESYADLGHYYTVLHLTNWFCVPPAGANIILCFFQKKHFMIRFLLGTICCWILCMTMIISHICIDESIAGVDNGPFYMNHPTTTK